jgi:hypothetical protein
VTLGERHSRQLGDKILFLEFLFSWSHHTQNKLTLVRCLGVQPDPQRWFLSLATLILIVFGSISSLIVILLTMHEVHMKSLWHLLQGKNGGVGPHGPRNIFSVIYLILFLVQSALYYFEGLSLKKFVNLSLPILIRLLFDICLLDLLQSHRISFIIILYHDNYFRFSVREKKLCLKLLRFFEYKKSNSFSIFSDKKNDY